MSASAVHQAGMLRTGQRPSESLAKFQQALAAIRENSQLDVIRAKRHRAEREQVDLFGCQPGEQLVRLPWFVLDSRVEVFHGSNTERHLHRLSRGCLRSWHS